MKWLNILTMKLNYSKRRENEHKRTSNGSIQSWAMKVMRSSETVAQAMTGLRLMELAGMTDTEEYKVWSEFENLTR